MTWTFWWNPLLILNGCINVVWWKICGFFWPTLYGCVKAMDFDCWYVVDSSICWTWIWTQHIMTPRHVQWERIHLKAKVLTQQSKLLTCLQSYLIFVSLFIGDSPCCIYLTFVNFCFRKTSVLLSDCVLYMRTGLCISTVNVFFRFFYSFSIFSCW